MSGAPPDGTATILLVEDDEDIRELFGAFLELKGYSVLLARDGEEALDRLHRAGALPRVILLDLMMPRMDGFAFRAAQEHDPRLAAIPTVILSADPEVRKQTASLRAAGYIRKPIDTDLLMDLIERLCHDGVG